MDCCLGTLNSFLSVMKRIWAWPSFCLNSGTQSLKIPSRSKSPVLNVTHPPSRALRVGTRNIPLLPLFCSWIFQFLFFFFNLNFEDESSSWSLGSRTCCGLCQGDLVAAGEVSLAWAQGLSITTWIPATRDSNCVISVAVLLHAG